MKSRTFNARGFSRMMDAFEGAPRGSIRLTAHASAVMRQLQQEAAPSDLYETLLGHFNEVVHGDIDAEAEGRPGMTRLEVALEELDWRTRSLASFLNRVRNTANKVAAFRRTGSVR